MHAFSSIGIDEPKAFVGTRLLGHERIMWKLLTLAIYAVIYDNVSSQCCIEYNF
jgi:hypothetical protein